MAVSETGITGGVIMKHLSYIPAFLLGMSMHSFTILFVFIMLDMVTGIWRVWVTQGPAAIKSRHAINGLASKMLFMLIPLIIAYTGKGVGLDLIAAAAGCLGLLIASTGYSIIGNIYTIRTGVVVAEFDAVRFILNGIRKGLEKMTDGDHKA